MIRVVFCFIVFHRNTYFNTGGEKIGHGKVRLLSVGEAETRYRRGTRINEQALVSV